MENNSESFRNFSRGNWGGGGGAQKIKSPWRFLQQNNHEGPGKPAKEFLDESMTENEEKGEIIELSYVLNFHLTVYCKMAFLDRDCSKLLLWIFVNCCPISSGANPF